MKKTVVGTQLDPQYGWVTADVKQSKDFDPIGAAKSLYSSMYGDTAMSKRFDNLRVPKSFMAPNTIDFINPEYKDYKNLMSWYYAASNPQYKQGGAYKDLVDYYSLAFNKSQDNPYFHPAFGQGETKGLFGNFGTNFRQDGYSPIFNKYGEKTTEEAKAAIMAASMLDPTQLYGSFASNILRNTPGSSVKLYRDYIDREGGIPGQSTIPEVRDLFNVKDGRGQFQGSAFLSSFDPNLYKNPTLTRYFEGANPNLATMNDMPWGGVNDAKNLSWSRGGEFLTDEAFKYYKSKSTPGMAGTNWTPVGTNSNLLSGTFDGRQSFFTPYEYAIKGIPDEQAKVTNISAADPNFWAQQGNLQNINNTWGFVTQQDPYAGLPSSNLTLNPDTLTATYYRKKGGFLSGLMNALPSIGLGLIPGVGPFASIASGVQGIGSVASFFDKDKQKSIPSWYQPSIYPNWIA